MILILKKYRLNIFVLNPIFRFILFTFFVSSIWQNAIGQQKEVELKEREDLINRIEQIAEQSEQELDYTDLLDGLYLLLEQPINLNYASFEELKQLFFITDFQAGKLIEYRHKYGLFVSIYELQAIEGFDQKLIELIEPFVSVLPDQTQYTTNMKNVLKYGRHDIFLRYSRYIEQQEGYKEVPDSVKVKKLNTYYLGSPDRLYLRYSFNYRNKIRAGITADKDAGEEFFRGSQANDGFLK